MVLPMVMAFTQVLSVFSHHKAGCRRTAYKNTNQIHKKIYMTILQQAFLQQLTFTTGHYKSNTKPVGRFWVKMSENLSTDTPVKKV